MDTLERLSLLTYLLFHLGDLDSAVGETEEVYTVEVLQGDSAAAVVAQLEVVGLMEDGTLLRNYLQYRGLDTSIEAGGYELSGGMSVREIALKD